MTVPVYHVPSCVGYELDEQNSYVNSSLAEAMTEKEAEQFLSHGDFDVAIIALLGPFTVSVPCEEDVGYVHEITHFRAGVATPYRCLIAKRAGYGQQDALGEHPDFGLAVAHELGHMDSVNIEGDHTHNDFYGTEEQLTTIVNAMVASYPLDNAGRPICAKCREAIAAKMIRDYLSNTAPGQDWQEHNIMYWCLRGTFIHACQLPW